jgi:hypothetical protein
MEHLKMARQELAVKIEENELLQIKLHDIKREHQEVD